MPRKSPDATPLGFTLDDLLQVLRVAQHSGDKAAIDASWRILLCLFPLDLMTGRGQLPQRRGKARGRAGGTELHAAHEPAKLA